mgnify:CR=1 FL=1
MGAQPLKKNGVSKPKSGEWREEKITEDEDGLDHKEVTFLRRLSKNKIALVCAIYLILLVLCSVFANWLTSYDPLRGTLSERMLPIGSPGHILGTDELGRDMWARVIYGSRLSLIAAIFPVLLGTTIGSILGIVSGYIGGKIETIIMRVLDVFYAFPAILLAIAFAAVVGSGLKTILVCLTIIMIPPVARVAMSATKKVAHMEYIEAARTSGASSISIMYDQLFRNIFSPIFVYSSTLLGLALLFASGLSFLGLGVAPPTPEWGFMLNSLRDSIFVSPMIAIVPGFFIFITSMAFNLLSDGIRDAMEEK